MLRVVIDGTYRGATYADRNIPTVVEQFLDHARQDGITHVVNLDNELLIIFLRGRAKQEKLTDRIKFEYDGVIYDLDVNGRTNLPDAATPLFDRALDMILDIV